MNTIVQVYDDLTKNILQSVSREDLSKWLKYYNYTIKRIVEPSSIYVSKR